MPILSKTHAKFIAFQKMCKDDRMPSARLVAEKLDTDLKTIKRFAIANNFDDFYHLSLFRCSIEAAHLLLSGSITLERALTFLAENGHEAHEIEAFKKRALERKKLT